MHIFLLSEHVDRVHMSPTLHQSLTNILLSKLRLLLCAFVLCNFHLPPGQMLSILVMFYLHWFCVHVFGIVLALRRLPPTFSELDGRMLGLL